MIHVNMPMYKAARQCGKSFNASKIMAEALDNREIPAETISRKSFAFRYRVLETMEWKEKRLTAKGLKRLRNSGNNGYWEVYCSGWQKSISISYCYSTPGEVEITVHKITVQHEER